MKEINQFNIRWTQIVTETFMYGSILRFKPTETLFENELMPSGIVIHEWKMITAYDEESLVPALPILKKNKTYHFKFEYEAKPAGTVYFKIVFKRRNGTVCDTKIIKGYEEDVMMPAEAYSYVVQMINKASKSLAFRQIIIQDVMHHRVSSLDVEVSEMLNVDPTVQFATVIFVDNEGVQEDAIRHINNCILVTNWNQSHMGRVISALKSALEPYQSRYILQFVGYSARSNEMAYSMGAQMDATVFATPIRHPELQQQLGTSEKMMNCATIYQRTDDDLGSSMELVAPILNQSHQLYGLEGQWVNGGGL
ncbi:accessory Sec system protein Asp3 [Staphylococcus delphini]|uniref:Accessory Sec system protein Asp3 n=1 Tax=Staphylococcus delphini TaxID=53344 RepID=A0A2A4GXZ8_9STAP|nr:accessory Sec system protein Asp3 [Staphylococcus delphini]PCF55315.1 accessory Sec system protein Asp3 [Staphylococcus delphini]PCF60892.1 accessory Sec system protein Asp3 [Staphylococcus delphini]HEC2157900.1 accessory Sec system protein Asp3 [Staphylococcus delphini]